MGCRAVFVSAWAVLLPSSVGYAVISEVGSNHQSTVLCGLLKASDKDSGEQGEKSLNDSNVDARTQKKVGKTSNLVTGFSDHTLNRSIARHVE
ncbi:MAG: hypothetical protein CMM01_21620 [Rhodopirellula sp.]|nr:hypothetical protein [Rhodopirellula sp.]